MFRFLGFTFLVIISAAADLANAQGFLDRSWQDASGKYAVNARLQDVTDSDVSLLTKDGRSFQFPKSRLGPKDLLFLESVEYLRASEQQFDLMLPHADRMETSPLAISEIVHEVHKRHPKGFAAGLFGGCIYATMHGKTGLQTAIDCTEATIQRIRSLNKGLPEAHRMTLISALNNRAILSLRERKTDRAVKYLKAAAELTEDIPFVVYHNATILLEVTSQPHSLLNLSHGEQRTLVQMLARKSPQGPGTNVPKRFMYSTAHDDFVKLALKGGVQEPNDAAQGLVKRANALPAIEPGYALYAFGSGFLVTPNLVVTNRHVVAGHEHGLRFRVRNEAAMRAGLLASVHKISPVAEIDLALLELASPADSYPLPLRPSSARLGEALTVLGYPDPQRFEETIASSTGIVNKLMENETKILHDAATNGGSSGGPCFDRNGNVIGVHYASSTAEGSLRKLAVSSPSVIDFLIGIPSYVQLPEESVPMEIPDMIDRVRDSVVLIECWADAAQAATMSSSQTPTGLASSDPVVSLRQYALWPELTCLLCNGTGFQDCRDCVRGVREVPIKTKVGVNQVNGQPIFGMRYQKTVCPTCAGNSGGRCSGGCVNGALPLK